MSEYLSILFAVLVLVGLVAYQRVMHYLKYRRLKRLWDDSQEAVREGRLEEAERALQQAVALEGLWLPARQLLAQVHALQGNLDRAEDEYKMASALQPRNAMGQFALGLFYAQYRQERSEDALTALERAVELDAATAGLLRQHQQHFTSLQHLPRFQALLAEN